MTTLTENELDFEFESNLQIQFLDEEVSSSKRYLQLLPTPLESVKSRDVVLGQVMENSRLTAQDHDQDVRHLVLKIPQDLHYQAGDVCAIHPANDSTLTSKFIKFLGQNPQQVVILSQLNSQSHSPDKLVLPYNKPISLFDLFSSWINFLGVPTRSFPRSLLKYTKDDLHLKKLREFCQKSKDVRQKRTYYEFLYDFSSIKIPLHKLIPLIGNLKYREYSIASSPTRHPGLLQLCIAVLKYQTPLERNKIGVCSSWVANQLKQGQYSPIWIKRGTLKLLKAPLKKFSYIFVGPGTGVAPLRSLIWQLDNETPITLFFGNRYRSKDFHYAIQWEMMKQKKNFTIIEAWSREQEHKVYVHHKIKENSELIKSIFQNKQGCIPVIYVCGRAKNMPRAVQNAFSAIVGEVTIEEMKKYGCYKVEAW